MRHSPYFYALLGFVILWHGDALAQVRVWQGTMNLPTYEEGMPDPNPPFDQFAGNKFNYPYVLRENLTSHRVNHSWRAIFLENEYLKCSVLPDIGGHLYTCTDKISGQSMFYDNSSIKKAAVGYRGAWAAFGIEFNFPVSHNWVSMSPVDFAFRKNDDASASVFVGNIDRVYGMQWQVELRLSPKSTLLEEHVTLSNRSDVRHRFYWWNNAGIRVSDDSRIVYPMRFAASHGFTEVRPWPLDPDGNDLSVIRNHTHGAVSYFVHGSREEFMGVWHPSTKTGTVHFARYDELPAKKIWSWGVDEEGLDWRKALSDDNSGYVEVQAGLFRNQETYAFLEPRQAIHFSEYWMPVRALDGISRANPAGVVSLTRRDNSFTAGFNANRALPHASIAILEGNRRVFAQTLDLSPETTWTHQFPIENPNSKYTIEIRDARGNFVLRQTEGQYDWTPESEIKVGPQQQFRIPDSESRSSDDWIQVGKDLELNGRLLEALQTYKEALRRFPGSFAALKSAGRLSAALLRYEEAKSFLEPVRERDTSDPEIAYYLGIAYAGLGDVAHAQESFEAARRFGTYQAAANLQLGEIKAREENLKAAERYLDEAHVAAPDDIRVTEELSAIRIALGKSQEGKSIAQQGLKLSPESYFLQEVAEQPNLTQLGNDANRILNVAAQYMRLGLYQRALNVLTRKYPSPQTDQTELGALSPNDNPLVAYFRGYCRSMLKQSPVADYEAASKQPAAYVFPSSADELSVLHAVVESSPQDANAHYLLGTLYFSKGLTNPALDEWSRAHKLNPAIPVLDASLGLALLHEKNDPQHALNAFQDGLDNDSHNVTVYLGADQALSLLGKSAGDRAEILAKYPDMANAPSGLIFELILNLAEAGDFPRAESLFHNRFFAREEGGTNVRQVWVEVQLQKIIALAKAGQCNDALAAAARIGESASDLSFTHDGLEPMINSARTQFLAGTVYEKCGNAEEAKAKLQLAAAATAPDQTLWAWQAARKLPGYDDKQWQDRLRSASEQAQSRTETSSFAGWWYYSAGALDKALGRRREADAKFQKALLLPDRMLAYHFARLARADAAQ
jgi:tetratricopeptide (TPR) repeat protein